MDHDVFRRILLLVEAIEPEDAGEESSRMINIRGPRKKLSLRDGEERLLAGWDEPHPNRFQAFISDVRGFLGDGATIEDALASLEKQCEQEVRSKIDRLHQSLSEATAR